VSGFLGLSFLMQTLNRISIAAWYAREREAIQAKMPVVEPITATEVPEGEQLAQDVEVANMSKLWPAGATQRPGALGPLDQVPGHFLGDHVRKVFVTWILVFGLVGAQMSWLLRPFIGDPDTEFAWLRPRGSNFFEAVGHLLWSLFIGTP
jgi:hypothetical protein